MLIGADAAEPGPDGAEHLVLSSAASRPRAAAPARASAAAAWASRTFLIEAASASRAAFAAAASASRAALSAASLLACCACGRGPPPSVPPRPHASLMAQLDCRRPSHSCPAAELCYGNDRTGRIIPTGNTVHSGCCGFKVCSQSPFIRQVTVQARLPAGVDQMTA